MNLHVVFSHLLLIFGRSLIYVMMYFGKNYFCSFLYFDKNTNIQMMH